MAHRPCFPTVVFALAGLLAVAQPAHAQAPLDELVGGSYMGFPGGLYPGGNQPPASQADAARAALVGVVPRAADGSPDPMGTIGFISIGMSNTSEEFRWFERNEDANAARQAGIVFVNGAIGSHPSEFWAAPTNAAWDILAARVAAAGVAPSQVQVAWVKLARGTVSDLRFPQHAGQLRDDLREVVRNARARFPNLRVAWLSSRIWGGWNDNPQRNEPLSYESAFAVRWLIEDQIAGDPRLGAGSAPVVLWGPYLWAAGDTPRSDGLSWPQADFEPDFIHPNDDGERKVGALLSTFFNEDPIASPWYRARSATRLLRVDAIADAAVQQAQPGVNFGGQVSLQLNGANGAIARSYLRFPVEAVQAAPLHALVKGLVGIPATPLLRQSAPGWTETGVTFSNAPGPLGAELGPTALFTTSFGMQVAAALQSPAATLDLVAFTSATTAGVLRSRESGHGPYLLVRLADDGLFESGFE